MAGPGPAWPEPSLPPQRHHRHRDCHRLRPQPSAWPCRTRASATRANRRRGSDVCPDPASETPNASTATPATVTTARIKPPGSGVNHRPGTEEQRKGKVRRVRRVRDGTSVLVPSRTFSYRPTLFRTSPYPSTPPSAPPPDRRAAPRAPECSRRRATRPARRDGNGVRQHVACGDAEEQRRDEPREPGGCRRARSRRRSRRASCRARSRSVTRLPRWAPRARRTPISWSRRASEYASTPYTPARASSNASPENVTSSSIVNRRVADRRRHDVVEAPDVGDGKRCIDAAHDLADRRDGGLGCAARVHDERNRRVAKRAVGGNVHRERRIVLEAALADVAHDADDFRRRARSGRARASPCGPRRSRPATTRRPAAG